MESARAGIEQKIERLLGILDEDIRYVQRALSLLDELRAGLVKRDYAALSGLLEEIRRQADAQRTRDSERRSMREEFGAALGWEVGEVTLSRLEGTAPPGKREELSRRKTQLQSLTEELKKEHLKTAMLLSDCARFNRELLMSILESGKVGPITYGSDGTVCGSAHSVLVSMQF